MSITTTRNKTLIKNTLIISIGKLGTSGISFFLLPLYTAVLEPSEYGVQELITTVTWILSIIFGMQLSQGGYRFLLDARNDKEKSSTVVTNVIFVFLLGGTILTILFFITDLFFHPPYIWYVYILTVLYMFFPIGQEILRGENHYIEYALIGFILTASALILNILFVLHYHMGVRGLLLSSIISYIVLSIVLFFRCSLIKNFSIKKINRSTIQEILAYSLPLVPNELSWWVIKGSDRIILSIILGVAANGVMSVAHKFPAAFILFYNYFNASWIETVVLHLKDDDHEEYISNTVNFVLRFILCLGIGVIAIMPFVFPIMVNSQYIEAYNQIPIFMIATLFNVVVGLTSGFYVANKNTQRVAQTAIMAAIINIIVHLATIKWIGIYAASISSLCAFVFFGLFRVIDSQKYCKIRYAVRFYILWGILLLFVLVSYYTKIKIIQICFLIVVIFFSLISNRRIFSKLLSKIKSNKSKK